MPSGVQPRRLFSFLAIQDACNRWGRVLPGAVSAGRNSNTGSATMASTMFADQKTKTINEVQKLTWALVDECATEKKVHRLERLLLDHEEARRTYVMCIQTVSYTH